MKQNSFNQLPKYEDIFDNLKDILNQYLEIRSSKSIRGFNLSQKHSNENGYNNNLIENDFTPDELINEIKSSYLSRDYVKGEIGLIDGQDQYDGIFNIALYMLMCNRLGKLYKERFDKNHKLSEKAKDSYKRKYEELMFEKHDAATKLIYSLYIYKETENDNDFFYGFSSDKDNNNRLIIDLPVYGQISIHFGSPQTIKTIKYFSRQNVNLILNKKLRQKQITKEQFNKLKNKAETDEIFPKYTGKLYEYSSGLPIDYCGEKFEMAQSDLKLSKKMVTEITDEDIKRISENRKYNSRELYYFAIKSDFSKSQLERLSIYLQKRDKELFNTNRKIKKQSIFNSALNSTTPIERQIVSTHEHTADTSIKTNQQQK